MTRISPLQEIIQGAVLIVIGTGIVLLSIDQIPLAAVVGVCLAVFGLRMIVVMTRRRYGEVVEQKALGSISLPEQWRMETNVVLDYGGDLDLLLTAPIGDQFAIEIKSYSGVIKKEQWMTGNESLHKLNGGRIRPDPIKQVERAAAAFGARPVIWLPAAKMRKVFRLKSGLIVVQGPQELLWHAVR